MAELVRPILVFDGNCPDCGERQAVLPAPFPQIADDFDWRARDYDSFRLFLMQELASRFPERQRWTPADIEVVIVELLAAALDRASHALDNVQAERFLESARRPQSVRRLLKLIGYDAIDRTDKNVLEKLRQGTTETQEQSLERYWRINPAAMEEARTQGPRLTGEVRRMVTLADHERLMVKHPLVARARGRLMWMGNWNTILISVLLVNDIKLDEPLHVGPLPQNGKPSKLDAEIWASILHFHGIENVPLPTVNTALTTRAILRGLVELGRMIGTEVLLESAKTVPISISLSVRAKKGFFRSELKQALDQVFASSDGGFFETGRFGFGEDLFASDIIEAAMQVEGVAIACLNLFKRIGPHPDQAASGVIRIDEDELVLCLNNRTVPQHGAIRITVSSGDIA